MSKNNIQPSLINDISPNNVKLPQRPCWDGWITPGRLQALTLTDCSVWWWASLPWKLSPMASWQPLSCWDDRNVIQNVYFAINHGQMFSGNLDALHFGHSVKQHFCLVTFSSWRDIFLVHGVATKQGVLSHKCDTNVYLMCAGPQSTCLCLLGALLHSGYVRKENILFFTPVSWCCTFSWTLFNTIKSKQQRSTDFWDSLQKQFQM